MACPKRHLPMEALPDAKRAKSEHDAPFPPANPQLPHRVVLNPADCDLGMKNNSKPDLAESLDRIKKLKEHVDTLEKEQDKYLRMYLQVQEQISDIKEEIKIEQSIINTYVLDKRQQKEEASQPFQSSEAEKALVKNSKRAVAQKEADIPTSSKNGKKMTNLKNAVGELAISDSQNILISVSYADKLKSKPSKNSKVEFPELPTTKITEDEFLDEYKAVYDILMTGNNTTSENVFLVEYGSVYPRVIARTPQISTAMIKTFYDLGFLDTLYFNYVEQISNLPPQVIKAASTFPKEKIKFLKFFHVAPEYQQESFRLIKIGIAKEPVKIIIRKSQPAKVPEFNKDMVTDRRAKSLLILSEQLQKEIELNQAAEFGISRQLSILSRRKRQLKPGTISQLKAFFREIEMNQLPSSNATKEKLCQLLKQTHGEKGVCLLCQKEDEQKSKDKVT